MRSQVYQQAQKLDRLFSFSKDLNEEQLANWARYLCILTSGFIENAVRTYAARYVARKSAPYVQNYVGKSMQSVTNLNYERLSQLLGAFSAEWGSQFDLEITQEQKDSLDSIVANRNNIAHGSDVGISFVTMKKYYDNAKKIIDLLDSIMDPERV